MSLLINSKYLIIPSLVSGNPLHLPRSDDSLTADGSVPSLGDHRMATEEEDREGEKAG